MSWLINLLTGLIAVLISAAMVHFGGANETVHPKSPPPAAAPDDPRSPDTEDTSR